MTTKTFRFAVEGFHAVTTTVMVRGEWRNGSPAGVSVLSLTKAGVEYKLYISDVLIGDKHLELVLIAGKAQDIFTKNVLKAGDILVGVAEAT